MSLDFIKQYAPNISPEAEDHVYKTSDDYAFDIARDTTNTFLIDKLLSHHNPDVREETCRNLNLTEIHLDKALRDQADFVRSVAAAHRNATKEHLIKALGDENKYVVAAAKRNRRYKEYFPNGHE